VPCIRAGFTQQSEHKECSCPLLPSPRYQGHPPIEPHCGALQKPVIGGAALTKAMEPVEAQRKNEKLEPFKAERIVVAPSGDTAYEYGTFHLSYDESNTRKHQDFTAAFLRVWKADDTACEVAAIMAQPEGER
jgi:hypothetical protein